MIQPVTGGAPTIVVERSHAIRAEGAGLVLMVHDLTKAYGSTIAVDAASFAVPAGGIVGLVGANGAGKTTTINCVAGLQIPDRGLAEVCGFQLPEHRGRLGAVLGLAGQDTALYPDLSTRVNLQFFSELAGLTPAQSRQSVGELTEQLELAPLLDEKVRFLSGGQRQLVHVAGALVHKPQLILLDEPTTGLDPRSRESLLTTIRSVAAAGAGVMFSSHRLSDVEQVCHDVVVLHRGRVLASGSLAAILAEHGEPSVEVRRRGRVERHPGTDVGAALRSVGDLAEVEAVTVVQPSLESVFLSLTGVDLAAGEERRR